MRLAFLAGVAALAAVASASGRFVLESHLVPVEWTQGVRVAADTRIAFTVALTQQNVDVLDARFWAVSTPGTPEYGQFLTTEEINDIVRTSDAHMSAALSTFNAQPGMTCEAFVDAMKCEATAAAIESLFQTELYTFANSATSRSVVTYSGSLSLPQNLAQAVVLVEGFSRFPTSRTAKVHAGAVDYVIAPESLDSFLSLKGATGSPKVIQSVAEFQSEPAYNPPELATFAAAASVPKIVVAKQVGPFSPGGDPESSLDIQYISSVGKGNTNWFITEADWLYSFAVEFNAATEFPSVISMSYGWYEDDQCAIDTQYCTDSYTYVARVNREFQKLGARGITLLASSGDSGAHGRTDDDCSYSILRPAFPASSPFVTAVGATMIKSGTGKIGGKSAICTKSYPAQCALDGTQIVASTATGALITSGGGFSNVAERPSYQDAVVAAYLKKTASLPPAANFNASGRGFPDVAALGHNYFIEAGGPGLVDGTSCSAPVWGGVIGLLNSYLVENGKTVLGFANPTLYAAQAANAAAFVDIVEGDNTCTEDTCTCSPGYTATAGWDAATGLGSPNYQLLLAEVKKLKGL